MTAEQDRAVRVGVLAGLVDINDFDDLHLTCDWLMWKYFMQRGVKERKDLLWSKIVFGTYEVQGPLYGLPCVELMRDFDKTCSLSLANPTVRTNGARLIYVHNQNDPLLLYTLLRKYSEMCPPTQTTFYCYKKTDTTMDRERRLGDTRYCSNKNKPKGYKQIKTFGQEIARRCGLSEWMKCTNHTWRAFGITRMANDDRVSISEAMGAARHASASAHQAYVRTSGLSENNRIMAISDVPYG